MSPHEDQLMAMGIERFTPFYEDYFSGSQKSMSLLICSMISQFMLPHRTAKEIEARIKSKCLPTSPANPIKVGIVLFFVFFVFFYLNKNLRLLKYLKMDVFLFLFCFCSGF